MKHLVMLAVLTIHSVAYAESAKKEFDELTEVRCYQESKALGCVPGNEEEDPGCVEKKKKNLSPVCRKLHESKK